VEANEMKFGGLGDAEEANAFRLGSVVWVAHLELGRA
jgi:hypothetical protein